MISAAWRSPGIADTSTDPMIELTVFIDKDVTLGRFDQIAARLSAMGAEIKAKVPTVNIIVVACKDPTLIPDLRSIPGVVGVRERRADPSISG
jgi:hypothetical protein